MATTQWVEEDSLADMKHRLDKLRVDQSRQKMEEEEAPKVDTLKILQSKFGSMVYDPTSPSMQAYERSCARSGRRKSIEFEDLYMDGGSGRLAHAHRVTSASSRGKHRTPSGGDHSQNASRPGTASDPKQTRQRKSSDPSSYFRKVDPYYHGHGVVAGISRALVGQGHRGQGQGQGHRSILSMTVSEEDKKMIDEKLAGIAGGGLGGGHLSPTAAKAKDQRSLEAVVKTLEDWIWDNKHLTREGWRRFGFCVVESF